MMSTRALAPVPVLGMSMVSTNTGMPPMNSTMASAPERPGSMPSAFMASPGVTAARDNRGCANRELGFCELVVGRSVDARGHEELCGLPGRRRDRPPKPTYAGLGIDAWSLTNELED